MKEKISSLRQGTLEDVKQAFSEWRRTRKSRTPIPAYLWEGAVKLSEEYSVQHISKVLHLNHTALKKRFEHAESDRSLTSRGKPIFVELDAPQGVSSLGSFIEMESPKGFKMRMQIPGESSSLLLELGKGFMRHRP